MVTPICFPLHPWERANPSPVSAAIPPRGDLAGPVDGCALSPEALEPELQALLLLELLLELELTALAWQLASQNGDRPMAHHMRCHMEELQGQLQQPESPDQPHPQPVMREGALRFTAGAAIDVDGEGGAHGDPCKQWQTSLRTREGRSLNADTTAYFVLPPQIARQCGARPGDLGLITYRGKTIPAVFGDVGPRGKLGEISRYAAQQLGIDASATRGGVSSGVHYQVFPGSGSRRPSAQSLTPQALAARMGASRPNLA